MKKQEFLTKLRAALADLPQDELEERLLFYSEMIDDRIEEGMPEEEAVQGVGSVCEIAMHILADVPPSSPVKETTGPKKRMGRVELLLLVLGFPLWFPLLVAAFSVVISLYAALWAVVVSLWAVLVSLWACTLGGVLGGIFLACSGHALSGAALISAGVVIAGVSIFLFGACRLAALGAGRLVKKLVQRIKRFAVKEA